MVEMKYVHNLLERIVRLESKMDTIISLMPQMNRIESDVTSAIQSAKSAHHRIDGIYRNVLIITGVISLVIAAVGRNI